jgi:hypothetical protein
MKLSDLLHQNECEWLDFKQEFHDNNFKLLHDIICLANAETDKDKYLVFGIANNKTIVGIENDNNRKTSADIQDLLKKSNFNRIPKINLEYIKSENNHEIGLLRIFNKPDKPYFLTKDKQNGKNLLRAGVVYTRIGDTNIPLNGCAPEERIEQMWRERFNIDLPPLQRMEKLLEQTDAWEEIGTDGNLYHRDFPEFKIVDGKTINSNFVEGWSKKFPDPHASSFYVELWHNNTHLKRCVFVWVDGARYKVPLPEIVEEGKWWINKNSIEYKIAKLYDQYHPLEEILPTKGVKIE